MSENFSLIDTGVLDVLNSFIAIPKTYTNSCHSLWSRDCMFLLFSNNKVFLGSYELSACFVQLVEPAGWNSDFTETSNLFQGS